MNTSTPEEKVVPLQPVKSSTASESDGTDGVTGTGVDDPIASIKRHYSLPSGIAQPKIKMDKSNAPTTEASETLTKSSSSSATMGNTMKSGAVIKDPTLFWTVIGGVVGIVATVITAFSLLNDTIDSRLNLTIKAAESIRGETLAGVQENYAKTETLLTTFVSQQNTSIQRLESKIDLLASDTDHKLEMQERDNEINLLNEKLKKK